MSAWRAELEHRFLLQVSYEQQSGRQDFQTSRSRIVIFQRAGAVLNMLDVSDPRDGSPTHVLATIPIRHDVYEPIVFVLSSAIPKDYRAAVRDGVLYWNRAFGRSLIRVIDAPPSVRAPSPDYNEGQEPYFGMRVSCICVAFQYRQVLLSA